ncbi:MAG: DUF6250 domain-containing protein [Opitutaceae bacterium]
MTNRGLRPFLVLAVAVGALLLGGCAKQEQRAAVPGGLLHTDDFLEGLTKWTVEQQPGGTVTTEKGKLVIDDRKGCTVWFNTKLAAPVIISYTATLAAEPRTSDLNCFWMATDPARPGDLLEPGHSRDGSFASYDRIRTYYAGYGGNANTTTRFRRYPGDGTRPILPEHDLSAPEVLLKANHPYRIELIVIGNRIQYVRDNEVIFDFTDPEPLHEGWFGIRTVLSHIEITDFAVHEAVAVEGGASSG